MCIFAPNKHLQLLLRRPVRRTHTLKNSTRPFLLFCVCGSGSEIALLPGSHVQEEKKEPGTQCLCMLSSPRISGILEISEKSVRLFTGIIHVSVLSS